MEYSSTSMLREKDVNETLTNRNGKKNRHACKRLSRIANDKLV